MCVHTLCLWAYLRSKVPKACMEDVDTLPGVLANSLPRHSLPDHPQKLQYQCVKCIQVPDEL